MAYSCEACTLSVTAVLDLIGGEELATAEGAAKAAQLIIDLLDKVGIQVPKKELVDLILDNIVNGISTVANLICKKVGCC